MRLYHGSNIVIDSINLAMCRPYKDFGKGFYLTDIKEQAENMAVRVAKIYGGSPVVNTFEKLQDKETGLYMESSEYVYDLFKDEINFGRIVQAEI